MIRNGHNRHREARRQREDLRQERTEQRNYTREQRTLEQAFNQGGGLDRDLLRELLDVKELEEKLDVHTVDRILAILNKQWMLANLTEAEAHDKIWWLEVQKYKILGSHPPPQSPIQGPIRAFLMDDETEDLHALNPRERTHIDQIIKGLQNMVTRSRGGFERRQQQTSIARSETDRERAEKKKKFSLFGLRG